jgi:ribosomal protein S18 acetylase RimI-like enzyme
MELEIREYRSSDESRVVELMEDFQDYLVGIDYMKRTRRMPEYGISYVSRLLRKINNNDGVIYLAESQGHIIGLIAAAIEVQSKDDLLECIPSKAGRILELFVQSRYRGQSIGKLLMERGEAYLKEQGCDELRVEVFEPNVNAHNFYKKLGYQDRIIDLIKKV